jgi:hypothetical protein
VTVSHEKTAQAVKSMRESFCKQFGEFYDDGQLEAVLFGMLREKMILQIRSVASGMDAGQLQEALRVLRTLDMKGKTDAL